jgi:hypothetical protein
VNGFVRTATDQFPGIWDFFYVRETFASVRSYWLDMHAHAVGVENCSTYVEGIIGVGETWYCFLTAAMELFENSHYAVFQTLGRN